MKLGIVGTGMIAKIVGPYLTEWGCTVQAVAGTPRSVDQARELAEQSGASEVFESYEDMLAGDSVDTIYLAVPNFLHHAFAKRALEAGRNVIVEKPFCSNSREAQELSDIARAKGLMVFEAITIPYLPNYLRLRSLLKRIGDIKIVTVNYSQYSSRYDLFKGGTVLPAFDPAKSGGAIMDLGLYNLHFLIGLFGEPKHVRYDANIERSIDTSGIVTLSYDSFKAVSIAAKDCAAPSVNLIEGTDGYLMQRTPANSCGEIVLHLKDGSEERYDDSPEMRWECEFRAFSEMIEKKDFDRCYRMLDHTLAVARAITDARADAGVVFPADEDC